MAGSGEVVGLPSFPPRNEIRLSGQFGPPVRINSSIAAFVDISWRWVGLRPLFLEADYGPAFEDGSEDFIEAVTRSDPAYGDDGSYRYWTDLMLGW